MAGLDCYRVITIEHANGRVAEWVSAKFTPFKREITSFAAALGNVFHALTRTTKTERGRRCFVIGTFAASPEAGRLRIERR